MLAHVDDLGRDEVAVAKTLLPFAEEEEEEYDAYLAQTSEQSTDGAATSESANSFEAMVNGCDEEKEYTDTSASESLQNVFDSFQTNSVWDITSDQPQEFFNATNFFTRQNNTAYVPIALSHLEYFGEDDEFRGALLDIGAQKSVIG